MNIKKTDDFNKVHIFYSTISKRGTKSQNHQIFKAIDRILWTDPSTGVKKERLIRLIEGEPSIFADEQSFPVNASTKDEKELIDRRIYRFHFEDNVYMVSGNEINKLNFLRLSNANSENPSRYNTVPALFYEFNPEKKAREINTTEDKKIEAQYKAMKMAIEEGKAYLLVLWDNPVHASKIDELSVDEIRHELRRLAKLNPDVFVNGLQTTEMKNKYHIMKAISDGIVKTDSSITHLMWADGSVIASSVSGKNVIDFVAEKAKNDGNYAQILDELKARTNSVLPPMSEVPEVVVTNKMGNETSEEDIYKDGKARGLFWSRGLKVYYAPSPDSKEVEFVNYRALLSRLETDQLFRTEIVNKIEAHKALEEKKRADQAAVTR